MNEGNLGELFAALSKFQGVIEPAIKAKTGYGYKYADIESVIKAAQKPLVDNGLCVTHLMRPVEGGGEVMNTLLGHTSGQYLESLYPVRSAKDTPQDRGSAMTYARRYTFMAILGLPVADDDGSAASGKPEPMEGYLVQNAKDVNSYLQEIGWIKDGETYMKLPKTKLKQIANGFDKFKEKVAAHAAS
tara:strand:- start:223 stop:786 length:564 start_codon:yes stop_codon:yes gene_type:complete